jgi:hypothetical protein
MQCSITRVVRGLVFACLCASLSAAGAAELVVNGSFETNGGAGTSTFAGWTVSDQAGSAGSFFVQTGTTAPPDRPITVPAPPVGSFAAMSAQNGPGSHILYQDIAIPAGVTAATFSAQVYVNNAATSFVTPASLDDTVTPNQQARIDIVNPAAPLTDVGAGVLLNVFRTNAGDPLVSGYAAITADLTPFAGQTVRVRIAEVDNESNLSLGVDGVSVVTAGAAAATPVPTLSDAMLAALALMLLVVGLVTLRRRWHAA